MKLVIVLALVIVLERLSFEDEDEDDPPCPRLAPPLLFPNANDAPGNHGGASPSAQPTPLPP